MRTDGGICSAFNDGGGELLQKIYSQTKCGATVENMVGKKGPMEVNQPLTLPLNYTENKNAEHNCPDTSVKPYQFKQRTNTTVTTFSLF